MRGVILSSFTALDRKNPDYTAIHQKLSRVRGKASGRECIDCGGESDEWSWIHDTDPYDIKNYVTRCKACHAIYDGFPPPPARVLVGNPDKLTPENRILLERINLGESQTSIARELGISRQALSLRLFGSASKRRIVEENRQRSADPSAVLRDLERNGGSFGNCETCGEPREASEEDEDLVLQCPNGHRSLRLDLQESFLYPISVRCWPN